MHVVYDVSHNIAKVEKHTVNGEIKEVLVHRKGATRAFPPNHPDIPKDYQQIGQPVLIGKQQFVNKGFKILCYNVCYIFSFTTFPFINCVYLFVYIPVVLQVVVWVHVLMS